MSDLETLRGAVEGIFGSPMPAVEKRVAAPLASAVARAMAIQPARRFIEARELSSDLRAIAREGRGLMARHRSPPPEPGSGGITETRLLVDVLPEARARGGGNSEPSQAMLKRLQRLESIIALQEGRIARQESQLSAVASMETAAFVRPEPRLSPSESAPRTPQRWPVVGVLCVANLVLLSLVAWLLSDRISSLEAQVAQATSAGSPGSEQEPAPVSVAVSTDRGGEVDGGKASPEETVGNEEGPEAEPPVESPVLSTLDHSPEEPVRARPPEAPARQEDREIMPTAAHVTFSVGGGYLEHAGTGERPEMGAVPAGTYRAFWSPSGEAPYEVIAVPISIPSGAMLRLKCSARIGQCNPVD